MDTTEREKLSVLIRKGRLSKGMTQQELATAAGLSLRSVQRIENGEVLPRAYSLRVLFDELGLAPAKNIVPDPAEHGVKNVSRNKINRPQKIVITAGTAIAAGLLVPAFIFQSPTFPESAFELFVLLGVVIILYALLMFRVWK